MLATRDRVMDKKEMAYPPGACSLLGEKITNHIVIHPCAMGAYSTLGLEVGHGVLIQSGRVETAIFLLKPRFEE